MPLTARQIVRVLVGDRKKVAISEYIGLGDGVNKVFQFDMFPVLTDTVTIYLTGSAQASGSYAVDYDTGQLSLTAAATNGHTITANYQYVALSDAEIDEVMSGVGTGKTLLVAANCAAALAADASRWFSYVMGDKEINKNDIGRKLLDLSKELENKYYRQRDDGNFDIMVATLQDATGEAYFGYDDNFTATIED